MLIDYSVSIGNILTIITVIFSVVGLVYSMKNDIALLQNDMSHVQSAQKGTTDAVTQMGKVLTSVAVQDTRISMVEKRVDELSHGRGFVK